MNNNNNRRKRPNFLQTRTTCSELPPNTSTMMIAFGSQDINKHYFILEFTSSFNNNKNKLIKILSFEGEITTNFREEIKLICLYTL